MELEATNNNLMEELKGAKEQAMEYKCLHDELQATNNHLMKELKKAKDQLETECNRLHKELKSEKAEKETFRLKSDSTSRDI